MIEVDVETTGLQWYHNDLVTVQFFDGREGDFLLHPYDHDRIQRWLSQPDGYRAWNGKFDFHFLDRAGYTLPPRWRWNDGMVAAQLVDERPPLALKKRHEYMFGVGGADPQRALRAWLVEENKRRRAVSKETGERFVPASYADVPEEILKPYAMSDVYMTADIGRVVDPIVAANPAFEAIYAEEMVVMSALYDMETRGIPFNRELLERLHYELATDLDMLRERAVELAGKSDFNPDSPMQLAEALQRRGADLTFVTKSSKTGNYSMDAENLATVPDALARTVEEFRATRKMLTTYVGPMLQGKETKINGTPIWKAPFLAADGRVHSSFNQVGAITGRMSSSDPNMQNMPRDDLRLRYAIEMPEGESLVMADLDSIELKLFAAYVGEGPLLDMVRDPDGDPHTHTALAIGLEDFPRPDGTFESKRQRGKKWNYSRIYGAGVRSCRKWYRKSMKECQLMGQKYDEAYPEVKEFQEMIEWKLQDRGYVQSHNGRRFRVKVNDAYKAVNYLVQGTAAEILKHAIAELQRQGIPMIAPIHDEIWAQVPDADAEEVAILVQKAMTDFPDFQEIVPITAEAQIVKRASDGKKPGYVPKYAMED